MDRLNEKKYKENRLLVQDRVHRAVAIVKAAKLMETNELLKLLSDLRLGSSLKISKPVDYALLNRLLVETQPAHLQKRYGQKMDAKKRDAVRH